MEEQHAAGSDWGMSVLTVGPGGQRCKAGECHRVARGSPGWQALQLAPAG